MMFAQLNYHDRLKLVAIASMVCDHIGYFFFPKLGVLRLLGRVAAPIFCFLIGFTGSKRISYTLVAYGLFLTYTNFVLMQKLYINILITLSCIRLSFYVFDYGSWRAPSLLAATGLCALLYALGIELHFEYVCTGWLIAIAARQQVEQAPSARMMLWISMIFYAVVNAIGFDFWHSYGLSGVFIAIIIGLTRVLRQLKRTAKPPETALSVLQWISRHSLHVYFWHVLLLELIFVLSLFNQQLG
jgi:uncharacterized membrane protein